MEKGITKLSTIFLFLERRVVRKLAQFLDEGRYMKGMTWMKYRV